MPTISPHSAPPWFHPTRDYWFTHNLLFNIREQTFQNLCNLSISMCLSYGFVCASAGTPCLLYLLVCIHCIQLLHLSVKCFCDERETSLKNECPTEINEIMFFFFLSHIQRVTKSVLWLTTWKSAFHKIERGIPKGTILGRILFSFCISNLTETCPDVGLQMYSDDTAFCQNLYISAKTVMLLQKN